MTQEMKPCPFCGGDASADGHTKYSRPLNDTWWADGTAVSETFFVNCMKCGARSQGGICDGYQTRAEAITAWNTRAIRPVEAAADDLLAALIILRDFLRENGTKSARADAAIAKATGQQVAK